ncbi:telomere-protecting terminal protein Tpg [Streptomyces murinus]|uniref:telomere-protecting terminal protein Tpg n=1 Tax=Streptomyces murinus TaxID=33900 RepID=UPI003800AAC9
MQRYRAGQQTKPQKRLQAALVEETESQWQPQVRAQARERAATSSGMMVEVTAYFEFTCSGSSDDGRIRTITTPISPIYVKQILKMQEAGATEEELHPIVAEAITESYFAEWGTRADGLRLARIGRRVVRRRAKGMDAGAVAAALEDARFDARQDSRHEDLADDVRAPAELAEWERIAQLLAAAAPGTVYEPDVDDAAEAAAAAAREAELREAARIAARADELQALRELGTLEQAEPRDGDEAVRDELTRRAGGYVQADVDAWLAHALAAHLGHYRDPAARETAADLLTPPVLAHAALLAELARLAPGVDVDQLAFAARLATTEPEATGALAVFLARVRS